MAPPCRPRRCSLMHRPCLPSIEPPCHTPCYSNRHNHHASGPCQSQPCRTRHRKPSLSTVQETCCSTLDQSGSCEDITDAQECQQYKRSGQTSSCTYKIPKPTTCSIKFRGPCEQSTSTYELCPAKTDKGCEAAPVTCDEGNATCDEPGVLIGCSRNKPMICERRFPQTKTTHTCPPSDSFCQAQPKPCKSILVRPNAGENSTQYDSGDDQKPNKKYGQDQKAKKKLGGKEDQNARNNFEKNGNVDCECEKEMMKGMKSPNSVETQKSIHDKRTWKADCGVQQSAECPVCERKKRKRSNKGDCCQMPPSSSCEDVSYNEIMNHDTKCCCASGIALSSDDDICTKLGCELVSDVELASAEEPVVDMVKSRSSSGDGESASSDMDCHCKYPPAFGEMPCTGVLSDTCLCNRNLT